MGTKSIIATLFVWALILGSWYTIPPMVIRYQWKQIKSIEETVPQKAIEPILKTKRIALFWHLDEYYLHTLLLEIKCRTHFEQSADQILNLLQREQQGNVSPLKELATSLYDEKLWNLLGSRGNYRHQQESKAEVDSLPSTWSEKRILTTLLKNIQLLSKSKALRDIPFSDYEKYFCTQANNQVNLPCLYDFAMWHSIELLKWTNRVSYSGVVNKNPMDRFFVPVDSFLAMHIETSDTFDIQCQAMGLYQQLLRFQKYHSKRFFYEFEIQRLSYLREQLSLNEKDNTYLGFLLDYRIKASSSEGRYVLDCALLNEYDFLGKQVEFEQKRKEFIRRYSKTDPMVVYYSHWDEQAPSVKFIRTNVKDVYNSNEPISIKVNYNQIDTLSCAIYKLPEIYRAITSIDKDSVYQLVTSNRIYSTSFAIKHKNRPDSFQIQIPNLPFGTYLMATGIHANLKHLNKVHEWTVFQISDLGFFYLKQNEKSLFYTVTRQNGKPIPNAYIKTISTTKKTYLFRSDDDGCALIHNIFLNHLAEVGRNGDTAVFATGRGPFDYNPYADDDEERTSIQTEIFTDRNAYRPGHTLHFKGILTNTIEEKNTIVPIVNRKVTVELKMYETVYATLNVTTNAFGSYSGEFVLPTSMPTGNAEVYTPYGSHDISVEEYKTSKIRLNFNPLSHPVNIGDSLLMTGTVSYTNGVPARYMPVEYSLFQVLTVNAPSLSSRVTEGRVQTNQDGVFTIRQLARKNAYDHTERYHYQYQVKATCTDENGETQQADYSYEVGTNACQVKIDLNQCLIKQPQLTIPVSITYQNEKISSEQCVLSIFKLKLKKGRTYGSVNDLHLDSLEIEKQVYRGQLTNQDEYLFDVSALNQQKAGFYMAEVKGITHNHISVSEKKFFVFAESGNGTLALPVRNLLLPVKPKAEPGETVDFLVGSCATDAYGLFCIMKNGQVLEKQWLHLQQSQQKIAVHIDEKHRGGITAWFISMHDGELLKEHVLLPVSFDNKKLNISFLSYRSNLAPGQSETWKLRVSDNQGKPVKAEMAATLYDQALDEIHPLSYSWNPFLALNETETFDRWDEGWGSFEILNLEGSEGAESDFIRYRSFDPARYQSEYAYVFPIINWDLSNTRSRYLTERRISSRSCDKVVDEDFVNLSTPMEFSSVSNMASPPMKASIRFTPPNIKPDEEVVNQSSSSTVSSSVSHARMRKNFSETAFFVPKMLTNSQGIANISFTLPDALTSWKMCGVAHTTDLKNGCISNTLVAQKLFMVYPNWPRFLRSGDSIYFSARIENNSKETQDGKVTLKLEDGNSHQTISSLSQSFLVHKADKTWVQWAVAVPYKTQGLKCTVVAQSGNLSDGEEMTIPVLTDETRSLQTKSALVKGNSSAQIVWNPLSDASFWKNPSGKFTFELFPDIRWNSVFALTYLADYPYNCAEQTFNKLFAYGLAENLASKEAPVAQKFNTKSKDDASVLATNEDLKSILLSETPWLSEEQAGHTSKLYELFNRDALSSQKEQLLEKLGKFQNYNGGIAWFQGMESSNFISFYILEGLGKLQKLKVPAGEESFTNKLITYCDNQMFAWYVYSLHGKVSGLVDMSMLNYARARSYFIEAHPISKDQQTAYNYLLHKIERQWRGAYQYQKPIMAMVLYRNGRFTKAYQIMEWLKSASIATANNGTFWAMKVDEWDNFNAIDNQSNTLELFREAHQDQKLIADMELWLHLQKKNNRWTSTISTARACYALLNGSFNLLPASYLVGIGSNTFQVSSTASIAPFRKDWPASSLSNTSALSVTSTGNPQAVGIANVYLQSFVKMNAIAETHNGLGISKKLLLVGKGTFADITPKTVLKVGDEIVVQLKVTADRNASFIHLRDLRPSCVEPLDKLSGYKWRNGLSYQESIRDGSQNFFMENLPKGTFVIEYRVRVTHKGSFETGNATLQSMYSPELFGQSTSTRLRVK